MDQPSSVVDPIHSRLHPSVVIPPRIIHPIEHHLAGKIADLKYITNRVAAAYRDVGLYYHRLHRNLVYEDPRIDSNTRKCARNQFVVVENRELPPLIHILGLIDHTLCSAASQLWKTANIHAVTQLLRMTSTWVEEAKSMLRQLEEAMDSYWKLELVGLVQDGVQVEGKSKKRRRREGKKWYDTLPMVCAKVDHLPSIERRVFGRS